MARYQTSDRFNQIKNQVKGNAYYLDKKEEEEKSSSSQGSTYKTSDRFNQVKEAVKSGGVSIGVDDIYINKFVSDMRNFLQRSQEEYEKLDWKSANDKKVSDYRSSIMDDLRSRGDTIRAYLNLNKNNLETSSYEELISYLDTFDSARKDVFYSFDNAGKFYSAFESEDDYNKFVADQKDYEEKKNYDISAGQRELEEMESALYKAKRLQQQISTLSGRVGGNAAELQARLDETLGQYDLDELEAAVISKKQYLNLAKRVQEGVTLSGVANPNAENYDPEFTTKSAYVSTESDSLWGKLTSQYGMNYDDLTYEYINQPELRDEIKQKARSFRSDGAYNDGESAFEEKGYDHLNKNEIAIYNYYYAAEGKKAAEKYLDNIQETLNQRKATQMYEGMYGNTALELVFGVEAGLDQFESGLKGAMRAIVGDDSYVPASAVQMASGMVREDLGDAGFKLPDWLGGASVGQVAYDATTTGANMLPSIVVGAAAGSFVGSAILGASAAGNGYQEMISLGYDKGQAQAYAAMVGASEAGLQYLLGGIGKLGGKLTNGVATKILSGVDKALARVAIKLGGNMLSEGMEEGLQEILTTWFQNLIMHTDEDVNWSEVAYSSLLGAITAVIMEGGSTISGEVNTYKTGKKLQGAGVSEQLVDIGSKFSADTVAYRLAGKVNEKTGAYTIGRLFNEIGATMTQQNEADIVQDLVRKGVDQEDAVAVAQTLADVIEGKAILNEQQKQALESYDVLATTVRDVIINQNSTVNQRMQGYNEALMALANEKSGVSEQDTSHAAQVEPSEEISPVKGDVTAQKKTAPEQAQKVPEEKSAFSEAVAKVTTGDGDFAFGADYSASKPVEASDTGKVQIAEIKGKNVTVKSEDGTSVNLKESDVDPVDAVRIETIARIDGISAADANTILGKLGATTGMAAQAEVQGAVEAYKYGYFGFSPKYITENGDFTRSLSTDKVMEIYEIGRKARELKIEKDTPKTSANAGRQTGIYFDSGNGNVVPFNEANRSGLTDLQKAGVKVATVLRKLGIGGNIVFFESYRNEAGNLVYRDENGVERKAPNGWYSKSDGSIHIDLNAGKGGSGTVLFTLSHELTHFIEDWSLKKYKVLADFLVENYENGRSMDELVLAKQERLSAARGTEVSYPEAYSEVVADSMEAMLADGNVLEKLVELKSRDFELFNKLKQFFDNLAAKIRSIYRGQTPDSYEGAEVMKMTEETVKKIQQLFADALVDASENYQSTLTPGEESVVVNQNGDPVAYSTEDGSVMLSMRTYDEEGREAFRDYLEKCVSSKKLTKAEMQEMMDGIEGIYQTCKEFKDKYAPFSSWSDAAVVRDTYGKPVFSVVTPNGDYKMNLDFSLVCKKRRTLDAVFNEMSKRGIIDDFELGQKSVVKINEIIRKHGFETACALCFVDAKRFRQASMADSFTSLYNELVLSLVPEEQRSSIDHFNFSGYATIKKVEDGIHKWDASKLDFSHLDYVMKNYGSGTVEHKAAKYIKSHAEGRRLLLRGDFMSSQGFDAVKTQNKDILKLYNSKKGTGGPKAAFGDVQYMNEIIQKARTWTPAKAYAVGGIRIQSFSDYVPRMVFDYAQMIYDLAATKLPAHAYTKEALFVKQFGLTGVKINMSLIPAIAEGGVAPGLDANGNYVWAGESFDFETAKQIQNAEGYTENCGTICVGVSDRHIRKLLSDPEIRMVIPYHKSGLNPIVAHMNKIAEFTDYTNTQNTRDSNGSKVSKDFDFDKALHAMGENGDPKAVVNQYLEWCDDHGYIPKFDGFRDHPNYYKLIEDFTLYDMNGRYVPQREVRAVFPAADSAFGSMKDLIQEGLQEDAVIEGRRDKELSSIVDEIQNTLPRTDAEIPETEVVQADRDLEAEAISEEDVQYSDRENTPTFYSHMARVMDGVKQEKLGAASVVSMLRGKGVKAEEIKWSGIEAFLDGKKSVTKAELQEFIAGSMLQIEEETLTNEEIPYTDEQKKRLSEYEGERDVVAKRLASEWKNITGEDFPITNVGPGLESSVARKIIDLNLEKKKVSFEGRLLEKLRKDLKEVISNNDDFGFDNGKQALISIHRNRRSFVDKYEMATADKAVIVKYCNALNAFNELPSFIPEKAADKLRAIAKESDAISNKIGDIKSEHYAEAAKYMPKWGGRRYNLSGGENYREVIFKMPGSYFTNEAMETHWGDRKGVLAHARIQDFNTFIGRMLFIEEIQSDWHNEGHKKDYRGVPDAPFRDTYQEYVLKKLIRMAAEQDYDSIGWTTAETQSDRWSDEFAEGYRIEYDQDIPKFLSKYGKKWGTSVGKTALDNGTTVWSMAITDEMKESVLNDGQPLYQDRPDESVSNRSLLANAFEGIAQNDIERRNIEEYKGKVDLINAEEHKLRELREQIKELSFAKGPRDTKKIRELQFDANQAANRINTYDRQLLRLEASKPLQDVLSRARDAAYKRAEKKGKDALAAYKEKAAKTQRELLERYQEARKKGVEGRRKTEMRHKIKDVVNELNQYLLKGTKDRHVPIELQKAVAEALDAVNMDTVGAEERIEKLQADLIKAKTPEQIQEISRKIDHIQAMGDKMNGRLQNLKDAYDKFLNSDDPMVANSHDEVISAKLESVIESIGDTPLRDMSLRQLEDVYDMYRMVLTTVRNVNKAFKAKKSEEISTIANRVLEELDGVGKRKAYRLKGTEGFENFDWNNLKPVYAFERVGSGTLSEVFSTVREGEDVWATDVTEAREYYLAQVKKYGYDSWNFSKRYRFTSTSGMTFDLSLDQILSLYAYSKREQAAEHLKRGGIVFDKSTEVTMKTKWGIKAKFNPTQATAYNISEETLADIVGTLTDEQKAFADDMQEYLSSTMGAKGNEVSLALYGVKLFKEKFYFPLKSATQFMAKAKEQQQGDAKVKNYGFTKETVQKASNPIVLTPFMEVWANHVNEMSMYHAFVLPMEDFYRVYNYRTPTSETMATESVQQFIQNAHNGEAPINYIDQLLKDLNGGARSDPRESFSKALMSKFKAAAVMASMSVVVQQPTAIVRAMALVDARYFGIAPITRGMVRTVNAKKHKALWSEIKQYAPVAIIKEMGYFDTNMGMSTKDFILSKEYSGISEKAKALFTDSNYRDEKISRLPALADEMAWVSIWEAVKRETVSKHKTLRPGSEEFLKAVGERFTEVVTKTQVYDSVLSRSGNMRSKTAFMNMWTSFMAEPTTSINMVQDALRKGKRDKKYAAKAIGAVYGSVILNAALVSLVYAARDEDEDETFTEKYLSRVTTELIDGINPLTYIPFLKDVWSIAQGFDIERADMSLVADLVDTMQKAVKVMTVDTDDMGEEDLVEHQSNVRDALWNVADNIASLTGIPLKNVRRDINGVRNLVDTLGKDSEGRKTTAGSLVDEILQDVKASVPVWGWFPNESKGDKLYDAIISGDAAYVDRLKSGYDDKSSYNTAVRKVLRERDPRINAAAVAKNVGDLDEYLRIAREIIAEKHFTQDDVVAAINAEINALNKGESAPGAQKYSGMFKVEDFATAVSQGDFAMANAIKTDVIQTAQKNGKTAEEAEKSFNSSAKSDVKSMFLDGKISETQAISALSDHLGEDNAESEVGEWAFEAEYGFAWSERGTQFKEGKISADDLKTALMDTGGKTAEEAESTIVTYTREGYEDGYFDRDEAADIMTTYGGLTAGEAESKLRYADIKAQLPDTYVDDAWVDEYYKEVQRYGISIEVFVDYRNRVKGVTGEGKKQKRMAVINSLPITSAQKDALYYAEGWAASTIHEAPWH